MKARLHKGQAIGWVWQMKRRGEAVPLISHTDKAQIRPRLQHRILHGHSISRSLLKSFALIFSSSACLESIDAQSMSSLLI